VLLKLTHSFCVVTINERDDWRRRLGVRQGFNDGQALQIRSEVHHSDIDIFQGEADDVEAVLRITGPFLLVWTLAEKIFSEVTDQDNISFHKIS
jgi:hypothetical protein